MKCRTVLIILAAWIANPSLWAALLVPSQYPTLQTAVDAAGSPDTIVIASGNYSGTGFRAIQVSDKELVISSDASYQECTIYTEGHSFIVATDSIGPTLELLSVENIAISGSDSAIILGTNSNISVKNCKFSECQLAITDSAINTQGNLDSCIFVNNDIGVAIDFNHSDLSISNCRFLGNQTAFSMNWSSGFVLTDNIIAGSQIAMVLYECNDITVNENTIVFNQDGIVDDQGTQDLEFECNAFFGNNSDFFNFVPGETGQGVMLFDDPMFCDTTFSIFDVMSTSPLLPANNECSVNIGNVSVGCICADIDNSGSFPDIADLTYLVEYMFNGGASPPFINTADLDGAGGINISDLTTFVDYLFGGGETPDCSVN